MTASADLPLISVVLPTRGRPELVKLSVKSVAQQDYRGPIECLVIHDQEEPDQDLKALGTPTCVVTVHANGGTAGLAGARNAGLLLASGDFIASCDDDDVWDASKVRLQMERMLAEPDLMVVGAGIRLLMAENKTVEWTGDRPLVTRSELLKARRKELHSSTLLMRRQIFELAGNYDEALPASYAEDYEWLLRAVRHGPIGVVNEPLADIRKNNQSWFRERGQVVADALTYLLSVHPEIRESRRGYARILGQIAFARSTTGERGEARRYAWQALRVWPLAPHALLAMLHLATGVDPRVALRVARTAGRGIT